MNKHYEHNDYGEVMTGAILWKAQLSISYIDYTLELNFFFPLFLSYV